MSGPEPGAGVVTTPAGGGACGLGGKVVTGRPPEGVGIPPDPPTLTSGEGAPPNCDGCERGEGCPPRGG